MTHEPLGDAWEKLRWARHHYDILVPEIESYEQGEAYRFSVEINPDAGEYVFYIHGLEPLDPDLALVLGDCIHNARASLDCLITQLYGIASGEDPHSIDWLQFPLAAKPDQFTGAKGISRAKKAINFSGYLTRIEELQPYNASNPSVWGANSKGGILSTLPGVLKQLSDLDNVAKHRVVHTLWMGLNAFEGLLPDPPPWPSDFVQLPGVFVGDALENDAEVGRWHFQTPMPQEWIPTQAEMKRCLPLQISMDVRFVLKGVLVSLPLFLNAVGEVLRLFEPVVVHGKPPLPANAVHWPPAAMAPAS